MTENSQNNSIDWFGRKVENPTRYMLEYLEDQKLPIVEGCCNALPDKIKYLSVKFGHRGCWNSNCKKCMEMIKDKQVYIKYKDLNPYWDENDCCCVDIRGQKKPLPIKFLRHISNGKGVSLDTLKSNMVHK